jgi:hypothetical protein
VSRADRSKYRAKEREQAREKYANNPEKFIALSQDATLLEMQRIADFYTRLSRRNSIDNE